MEGAMKNSNVSKGQSLAIERREFVLGTTAALLLLPHLAFSEASVSLEASLPTVGLNHNQDLLISADPSFGKGKERVSAPGSGSEYLAAWLLGFAHGMNARDARPDHLRCPRQELFLDASYER
jgi:hypothetical protein